MVILLTIATMDAWDNAIVVHRLGSWSTGLGLGLALDMLGSVMLAIVVILGGICLAYSLGELEGRMGSGGFQASVFLLIAGLNGVVLATDLFNLFVYVELASVSGYVLVSFLGGEEELEASLKYTVIGTMASLLFLLGIVLIYDQAGTLNYGGIADHLGGTEDNGALGFGVLMVVLGIAMPAAVFPLHTWLADAHSRAPSAVSAMLSGASVQVAVFAMVRVCHQMLGAGSFRVLDLLPWAGLATALIGAMAALRQRELKRLLAYTTVSSGGISVLLLSLGNSVGFQALFLHLVNHASAKALLFLSGGCLVRVLSTKDFTGMRGAWGLAPGLTLAFVVGAVGDLGGPSLGFFAKSYAVLGSAQEGLLIAALVALTAIIVAVAYLRVIQCMLSDEPREGAERLPNTMVAPTIFLTATCLALGVLSWVVIRWGGTVAAQLMDRGSIVASLLGI
jgi:multicomponent Na+:H+ antiporter subunit D